MCRRHNILLTPHKRDSAQCGVMGMSVWCACRRHATTMPIVAYLRHAVFHHKHHHPKLRPAALLEVNRTACLQHATTNSADTYKNTYRYFRLPFGGIILSDRFGASRFCGLL